jgi:SAM-dependent methyltransferase
LRFNTVLAVEHFENGKLREVMLEVFAHFKKDNSTFPGTKRFAKVWEVAMCINGLQEFGAVRADAEILGVGSGEEVTLFYLTRHVRRVFATDLYVDAKQWSETARRGMLIAPETSAPDGYAWNPNRLVVQHMDARSLRYEDESFDGIFSCGSIEHFGSLDDIAQSAREMGRVLKPGGILTLATEFRIEGPSDGTGVAGIVIFTPEMLRNVIILPSGLEPVDELHLETTDATRALAYPLAEAVSQGIRDPSVALVHDRYTWTSVALCLRKPISA